MREKKITCCISVFRVKQISVIGKLKAYGKSISLAYIDIKGKGFKETVYGFCQCITLVLLKRISSTGQNPVIYEP